MFLKYLDSRTVDRLKTSAYVRLTKRIRLCCKCARARHVSLFQRKKPEISIFNAILNGAAQLFRYSYFDRKSHTFFRSLLQCSREAVSGIHNDTSHCTALVFNHYEFGVLSTVAFEQF